MQRREFLKTTALGILALPVLNELVIAHESSGNVSATIDVSKLEKDGAFLVDSSVAPEGKPLLIIRRGDSFVALSMRCTHKGCKVDPPEDGEIECPCHGSVYDLSGHVKEGPAPHALASYQTTYNAAAKTLTVTY